MTIEEDIIAWALQRPSWQQEVLTALARGEVFDAERVSELADRLLDPASTQASDEAKNLTLRSAVLKQVRLTRICNLHGVNALAEDQTLSFAPEALTVVYGGNGSGKSGYARLIKAMVSARHAAQVLPDVFKDNPVDPSAELVYQVDGQHLSQKSPSPVVPDLLQMRFFDRHCGDEYLTKTSVINYRPSALSLLDRLIEVCDATRDELAARIAANETKRLALNPPPETTAGVFVARLTHKTTDEEIDEATTLEPGATEALATALQELARLQGSDATKERARLLAASGQIKRMQQRLSELTQALEDARLAEIRRLRDAATSKRAAATIAASSSFDTEPLAGVGSETWRALWFAARDFSVAEAYHEREFPEIGEGTRCVLCQQLLDGQAKDRFSRFSRYMSDTTERDAVAAEGAYVAALDAVSGLDVSDQPMISRLVTLQTHDATVGAAVEAFLASLEDRRDKSVAHLTTNGPAPKPLAPLDLPDKLGVLAASLETRANATDVVGFQQALSAASKRASELRASVSLSEAMADIKAETARQRERHDLAVAKKKTDTAAITELTTKLTRQYASDLIRNSFNQETKNLKLDRVTLQDLGGSKGQVKQRPKLQDAKHRDADTRTVLSEGEQNALGLAGFFTEAEFDQSQSAIIFDDPVTSLDHVRRDHVALRLAQLAKGRQVIVFTHDVAFVGDLQKSADAEQVTLNSRSIERRGDHLPGICTEVFPWNARDFKTRLHTLRTDLDKLKKERSGLTSSEYEKRVAEWAGYLSEAWERAVRTEVLDQVFDRGKSEVRPLKFRLLASITKQDNRDYQDGYGHTSKWAHRHDNAPEVNYVPPEPDELEQELTRITEWQKRVRTYL